MESVIPLFVVHGLDHIEIRRRCLSVKTITIEPTIIRKNDRSCVVLIDPGDYVEIKKKLPMKPFYFRGNDLIPDENSNRDLFIYLPEHIHPDDAHQWFIKPILSVVEKYVGIELSPAVSILKDSKALILNLDSTHVEATALIRWLLRRSNWSDGTRIRCEWRRIKQVERETEDPDRDLIESFGKYCEKKL